jgi:hypothetical protein
MSGFLENLENVMFPEDIENESKISPYMLDMFKESSCECGKCNCSA